MPQSGSHFRKGINAAADPFPSQVTSIVGRLDEPTDGVKDFCLRLSDALRREGVMMSLVEAEWSRIGWRKALRHLRTEFAAKQGDWVLLHYTGLAWSRRGFPFGILAVARLLRKRGVRLAVVFHEPRGFQARGLWAWFRLNCQEWIIRRLFRAADRAIFTVPLSGLHWISRNESKARFVPIGSNIPEPIAPRQTQEFRAEAPKTVAVFCVTPVTRTSWEVAEICQAVLAAEKKVPRLRLIVFGRGAMETRHLFEQALTGSGVELLILGILPAERITQILTEADAFLYLRDELKPQHGSPLAAIACGLPVVAYGDPTKCFPLSEAGVLLAPSGDREALAVALIQVLSDGELWSRMHERSLETYKKYFAWDEIAREYAAALGLSAQEKVEPLGERSQNAAASAARSPESEKTARGVAAG